MPFVGMYVSWSQSSTDSIDDRTPACRVNPINSAYASDMVALSRVQRGLMPLAVDLANALPSATDCLQRVGATCGLLQNGCHWLLVSQCFARQPVPHMARSRP